MSRRFAPVLMIIALFAAACASGPEATVNELLEQVRLGDPLATRTYQENIAVLESQEAMPTLLASLENDPSPEVRQWCVRLLGRIGSAEALPALTAALSDANRDVREGAAVALVQLGEPQAVDAFIDALGSGSTAARITAIVELEKLDDPRAIPALADAARADDGMVSKNATDALGDFEAAAAAESLAEIALDSSLSEDLRRTAIMNLGRMNAPEAAMSLQQVAERLGEEEGAEALKQLADDLR